MSGESEPMLPPQKAEAHIHELARLVEQLMIESKLGAKPEPMLSLTCGIREYCYRLYRHFEATVSSDEPRKPNPFGFGPESSN